MDVSGCQLCARSSSSLLGRDVWTKLKLTSLQDTRADIERDKKTEKRQKQGEKGKGEEEENQSETVIRLQSIFVSDLFRILNRESRSTKTKDETTL